MSYSPITFSGVSNLSFSVSDLLTSVGWYRAVLGLQEVDYVEGDGWHGMVMIHERSSTVIELRQHGADPDERSGSRRTGVDHVGFEVGSRQGLDDWQEHFLRLSLDHTLIDEESGSVLTFRDPDGIQLRMVCKSDRP